MIYKIPYKDSNLHWFAAYTKVHQEKKAAEKAGRLDGVSEFFIPMRKAMHKWSDRTKIVDEILIPNMIFVRCTELARIDILRYVPQIFAFVNLKGPYNPLIVPDRQIADFQKLCRNSNESLDFTKMAAGCRVRVIGGPMEGMEGTLVTKENLHVFAVEIDNIGYATVKVDPAVLQRI